jgi:hypothetical protein
VSTLGIEQPPRPVRVLAVPLAVGGAIVTALAGLGPMTLARVRWGGTVWPGAPFTALSAGVRVMLLACSLSLLLTLVWLPSRRERFQLLTLGFVGLGGISVLAMAGDPLLIAILLLLLGVLHATLPSPRPFIERLRNPGLAAVLLGLGSVLLQRAPGLPVMGNVGVLGVLLGLVSAAGLAPYLYRFDPLEPAASSGLVWTAVVAPVLALVLVGQLVPTLSQRQATVFALLCIGFGFFNLAWGLLSAWRSTDAATAWRRAFLADWGLALIGFGLITPSRHGAAGAYLLLLTLVLVRLPLYTYARSTAGEPARKDLVSLLAGLALAGAAPFAGFAARLLLLEAAVGLAWPVAAVLVLAMLGWLGHSFYLGGRGAPSLPTARLGVGAVLTLSAFLGIFPGLVLSWGGY